MSINAGKIITIYGKPYFDILYDDTKQVKYCYKSLLRRPDFTCDMALKLPIDINDLFLVAYQTKNKPLMEKLLPTYKNYNDENPKKRICTFYPNINHVQLFNDAIKDDDVELLKISNHISKIPNIFVAVYTCYAPGDYDSCDPTGTTSRSHYMLDLAKYFKANKCYNYMESNLKLFIEKNPYYPPFPITFENRQDDADADADADLRLKFDYSKEGYLIRRYNLHSK
jgi:hypothetical protein